MNFRATCSNPKYAAFEIEKSVVAGQLTGYGAPNDRVKCPEVRQAHEDHKDGQCLRCAFNGSPQHWRPYPLAKRTDFQFVRHF